MIPLISAAIPTYNRLSFLKEAVESVLGQTLSSLELIIADDGSTDGTEEYGTTLLKESGIRYLRLKNSGLPGKVRNAGAGFAAGKYLAFLDSDDLWKPEKLERQLAFFQEHPDLPICHTRELWLRVTAKHQIGYIDEFLVIKRGGHSDQLSEKYGQIEIFRIKALQVNPEADIFTGEQRRLAAAELARKCRIYAAGCRKRGRIRESEHYLELAEKYFYA